VGEVENFGLQATENIGFCKKSGRGQSYQVNSGMTKATMFFENPVFGRHRNLQDNGPASATHQGLEEKNSVECVSPPSYYN
jgi:hypothetical protein